MNLVLLMSIIFANSIFAVERGKFSTWKLRGRFQVARPLVITETGVTFEIERPRGRTTTIPFEQLDHFQIQNVRKLIPHKEVERLEESANRVRTWVDVSGRFSTVATLEKIDADNATLKTLNGRIISVPINTFCTSDKALLGFIQWQQAENARRLEESRTPHPGIISTSTLPYRVFRDVYGQSVRAKLTSRPNKYVMLQSEDGCEAQVPIETLKPDDVEYLVSVFPYLKDREIDISHDRARLLAVIEQERRKQEEADQAFIMGLALLVGGVGAVINSGTSGGGSLSDSWIDCPGCGGRGQVFGSCTGCGGDGKYFLSERRDCKRCGGSGMHDESCHRCGGAGRIRK